MIEEPSSEEENELETQEEEDVADAASQSKKTKVIEILFERFWPSGTPRPVGRMIVDNDMVVEAIAARNKREGGKELSRKNPANFLKDLIRKRTCNSNWPDKLKGQKITARQVYGKKQVFEFIDYGADDKEPFPDRFDPVPDLPVMPFEALSIPVEARDLGRQDEPWLIQVTVSQRVLYTHLAVIARQAGLNVSTLAHLQVSVKTQPEIDATFIATLAPEKHGDPPVRVYVTAEAKQLNERILEHQIREQVRVAFAITAQLKGSEKIDAVMPVVFQVVEYSHQKAGLLTKTQGIYVVQFQVIERAVFEKEFKIGEKLHELPLIIQSRAIFEPMPPIRGISYKKVPTASIVTRSSLKRRSGKRPEPDLTE